MLMVFVVLFCLLHVRDSFSARHCINCDYEVDVNCTISWVSDSTYIVACDSEDIDDGCSFYTAPYLHYSCFYSLRQNEDDSWTYQAFGLSLGPTDPRPPDYCSSFVLNAATFPLYIRCLCDADYCNALENITVTLTNPTSNNTIATSVSVGQLSTTGSVTGIVSAMHNEESRTISSTIVSSPSVLTTSTTSIVMSSTNSATESNHMQNDNLSEVFISIIAVLVIAVVVSFIALLFTVFFSMYSKHVVKRLKHSSTDIKH